MPNGRSIAATGYGEMVTTRNTPEEPVPSFLKRLRGNGTAVWNWSNGRS